VGFFFGLPFSRQGAWCFLPWDSRGNLYHDDDTRDWLLGTLMRRCFLPSFLASFGVMMFSKCCLGEDPAKDGYDTLFRFSFFVFPMGIVTLFVFRIRLVELDLLSLLWVHG
jgi:hypothetical protein